MKLLLQFIMTVLLLSILSVSHTKAQTDVDSRAQNVYVELGGPGLLFSANYDTRFGNRRDGFGGRVGAGYVSASSNSFFSLPVQANYLLGKRGKYFEIGLGATYLSSKDGNENDFLSFDNTSTVLGTMTFGYRYQPVNGGFNFRASINPVFNSSTFVPYFAGISFGYTF